jgi:hypothetical protein
MLGTGETFTCLKPCVFRLIFDRQFVVNTLTDGLRANRPSVNQEGRARSSWIETEPDSSSNKLLMTKERWQKGENSEPHRLL